MSVLSSRDRRAICHVIESDEPHDCGKSTPSLVTFVLRHHVGKVTSSVFSTRDVEEKTILSLDQGIEVLCRLGEAHHVERLLPSQCGKTQMARMISKQTRKAIVDYVEYKYSRTVGLQYLSCYVALILVLLTIAYIILTIHVFSMNTAGGDSSRQSCKVCYIWRPRLPIRPSDERPPAMYGHFCMVPRVSAHDRYYCILKLRQNHRGVGRFIVTCSWITGSALTDM